MSRLRNFGRVLCALLLAAGIAACSSERHDAARASTAIAPPVQIAVLGDSLAFGTGAGDTSGGFAFRVYRALARTRPGSEITNFAIGGSTAADVARLQVQRLRERRFDVVLLCVGGNDVVRATPRAAFARSYRALTVSIGRVAPHAILVTIGVPDVSISPLFADHATAVRALARDDDRAVRAAASDVHAHYVDLFALTAHQRDSAVFLSQDRFHPSDEGHAQIAAATLPVVEAALRERRRVARGGPGRR